MGLHDRDQAITELGFWFQTFSHATQTGEGGDEKRDSAPRSGGMVKTTMSTTATTHFCSSLMFCFNDQRSTKNINGSTVS